MAELMAWPLNLAEYEYNAEDVQRWMAGKTSGVYGAEDNWQVVAKSGMQITVKAAGQIGGWLSNMGIHGIVFWNSTDIDLTVPTADGVNPRIDRVVVSWHIPQQASVPTVEVRKGTPASSPVGPALVNDGEYAEICLAEIRLAAGQTEISSQHIVDTRMDSSLCGIVSMGVEKYPTDGLEAEFRDWLDNLKTNLDENTAANLLNNIETHKADTTVHMRQLGYSKSGTTHALTGLTGVTGTVSCVFTASAAFAAGDTFTIDGTPYTIQLSNGESAEDNLFVTGAAVPLIVDVGAKKVNFKAGGGAKRLITEIIMWDQNWVCPKGVTTINARLFGGGGGGGFESRGGAGGGGGHMAYKALSVTPGTSYPITIGTGGVGGSNGSAGGTTSFGSLLSASGGSGAQATVAGSGGTGGGGGYIREGGSGSYGGGGGGSTGGGGGDDGGDGGNGGPYGGGGGGAGAPNSVASNVGRGGTGGENGGNGGNGGKYTSVAAQNGANGTDTTKLNVDFTGTGLGGAAGDGSGAYTGGGGGGGGYGGNGGNGGKHTSSVDGGGGGGGGYGGNGGNGGGDYGGGGGGYGGNGGPGGGGSTGGGGGGGYGPNGNGGSGEKNGYHHGGIAAGGSGGTSATTCGNGGQGICIITYMG